MATFDAILRIGAKTTGTGDVRALQGALSGLSSTAATARTALGSLTGLGAVLGAGLSVAALGAASKGILDVADSLDELSQRTGTSVELLSKLGLAAQQSGLDTEQVSGAMVKLSKNLGAISTGGGEKAAAALSALGISATDATGNLKTADQVLLEVADRFQNLPDGVTKAQVAMDLFGKSGAALIPMLNMGSGAIERLNTGISKDFAKNAGIYNDQLANLQAQAGALGATVLEALLPSLIKATSFTSEAVKSIADWVRANRDTIAALVGGIGNTVKAFAPFGAAILAAAGAWKTYRTAVQLASAAQALFMKMTPVGVGMLVASLTLGAFAAAKVAAEMKQIEDKAKAAGLSASDFSKGINDASAESEALLKKLQEQQDPDKAITEQKKIQAEWLKTQNKLYDEQAAKIAAQYQQQAATSDVLAKRTEQRGQLAQELLNVEQAQIGVAKAYLDNKLATAKTEEERRAISLEIINLEQQGAQAQYKATLAQIAVERELANMRAMEAERRFRQAIEELHVAERLGVATAQIRANAESARSALKIAAVENVGTNRVLTAQQQVAALNYQAASIGLQGRASALTPRTSGLNQWGNVFFINKPAQFATGGYVTQRTLAEIGEGGEPEYVVPQSKAVSFAGNILAGTTGPAALRKSRRTIALETLAADPRAWIRAADAFAPKGGWGADIRQQRIAYARSLGFSIGPTSHWGGGATKIERGPSLVNIRRALESSRAMDARPSFSVGGSAPVSVAIQTGPVQRRTDGDFVTLSDLERAVGAAVDQTMAAVGRNARQPSYRRRTGSR